MLKLEGILVISVFDQAGKLLVSEGAHPLTSDLAVAGPDGFSQGVQVRQEPWQGQSALRYFQEIRLIGVGL